MDIENTDLERRVFGARTDLTSPHCPYGGSGTKIFGRLQQIFTKHHTLGADEQDYTDTAAYAEQFIQQVVRLRDKGHRS